MERGKIQTVILCGGKGTRMGSGEMPKAMFTIGGRPLLWHIMRIYSHYGFNEFILCLGYKGNKIRDYFSRIKEWKIKFAETGLDTNTGGRIKKVKSLVRGEVFFATYGDGLSSININQLLKFHKAHTRTATLTAVRPFSPFGIVGIDAHSNAVTHFEEKPILDHWINGGFFVFNQKIFDYLKEGDILEKDTFRRVLKNNGLAAYKHYGFWECMDTYKDNLRLNQLWDSQKAPWAAWKGKLNE
ncbi:MAG: sugar phosphate nucleotidyltransferase [Candidatus Omnitrophota bacterium]